jgi:hypothetical protein
MSDDRACMIHALENALADARSGRLTAFAMAGLGQGEHVISYSFDDHDAQVWASMVGATQQLLSEVIMPRPEARK